MSSGLSFNTPTPLTGVASSSGITYSRIQTPQLCTTHNAKVVPVDQWIEVVLGVPIEKISQWSNCLPHEKLLYPSTPIMKNLRNFCGASNETHSYIWWSEMVNNIISVAPGLIPGLPRPQLPIVFEPNQSDTPENRNEKPVPDIVILPQSPAPEANGQQGDDVSGILRIDSWYQALGCADFVLSDRGQLKQVYRALKAGLARGKEGIAQFTRSLSHDCPSDDYGSRSRITSTGSHKRKANLASSSSAKKPKPYPYPEQNEYSSTGQDLRQQDIERLANYALHFLSGTCGTRSHCVQLLVDGHRLMLWYYDAGGIVRSEWMNWIHDLPKFASIIVAFATLDIRGWGIGDIPSLHPPSDPAASSGLIPKTLSGYSLSMTHTTPDGTTQQVKVTLQNEVFTQQCLVGPRTVVYDITTEPEISKKPLVLKISMQESSRAPEHEAIHHAANSGVGHVPEMHMWSDEDDEWRLSYGLWGRLFPDNDERMEYKERYQRLIVFTKYRPIEGILCAANMHNAMMQLIDCIHDLRYSAHLVHRDISLRNLMYEQLSDGTFWLILNDFSLVAMVDDDGLPVVKNASRYRVGTLPFMAHELLSPGRAVTHYLRHDFESVFFVALWVATKPTDNDVDLTPEEQRLATKTREDMFRQWEVGTTDSIYSTKQKIITVRREFKKYIPTPSMRHYATWLNAFQTLLSKAYSASRAEERNETINGAITRYRIHETLRHWERRNAKEIKDFVPFLSYHFLFVEPHNPRNDE